MSYTHDNKEYETAQVNTAQSRRLLGDPTAGKVGAVSTPETNRMEDWFSALLAKDQWVELRALNPLDSSRPRVWSRIFQACDVREFVLQAQELSGAYRGVYWTLNPIRSERAEDLSARGHSAKDEDIQCLRWLPIDIDPCRSVANCSSTEGEKAESWKTADAVAAFLAGLGFPSPVMADSGNGTHLLYRIDLPVSDSPLVARALKALAGRFDGDAAKVDTAVFNPSRIFRLYGTLAAKGEDTPERPHRLSGAISLPAELQVTPRELIERLAAEVPAAASIGPTAHASVLRVTAKEEAEVLEQARRYVAKMDPAIDGQGGDPQTFKVAMKLIEGFDLTFEQAMSVMEEYNRRCVGPWEHEDLVYKLERAEAKVRKGLVTGESRPGYMLDRHEAVDDPNRLARSFIRCHFHRRYDRSLCFWQSDWYQWVDGAYQPISEEIVESAVTRHIKEEFDVAWRAATKKSQESGQTSDSNGGPKPKKVTTSIVAITMKVLRSLCIAENEEAPFWLGGTGCENATGVIAARNGLLVIPTGDEAPKLLPCTPNLFTTVALDYDIDLNAPRPQKWLEFLDQLWQDDEQSKQTLREWIGYCLVRDTSQQKLLFLIGPTRSGKSTISRVLTKLIGEKNSASPTLASFSSNFGLSGLVGKYLAVVADARLSGKTDQAQVLERILSITGEDPLTIDRKYRDPLTVRFPTRLVIVSNELPRIRDSSLALTTRIIFLQLATSWCGQEDVGLTDKLLQERPGILLWALEGLQSLRRRGHFVQPPSGKEALQTMREMCSPIAEFISQCCELHPEAEIPKHDLYTAYKHWGVERGLPEMSSNTFSCDLIAACPTALRTARPGSGNSRNRVYRGINLKTDDTSEPGYPPMRRANQMPTPEQALAVAQQRSALRRGHLPPQP